MEKPQGSVTTPTLGVLEGCRRVCEQATHVHIDADAVEKQADKCTATPFSPPAWNRDLHFHDGTERTVNYVLVLDALNFCFWPDKGKEKWRIKYGTEEYDGYWALAACLRRAIETGIPIWDASYLAGLTGGRVSGILRGKGEIPMFTERLAHLREVGRVLQAKWGGSFANMIEAAGGSAVLLVRLLLQDFPSFRDEAPWKGKKIPILKRAQILPVDLYGTFSGERWGRFLDLDQITAFADYKVPQILRQMGVLQYSEELAATVDSGKLIKSGDPMEVEIRAATVVGTDMLKDAINRRIKDGRPPYKAFEVDWFLWTAAQDMEFEHPYHLTRTAAY